MRLLIALQYYLPHRTGYTLHVQRVAEALVARGHSVVVLTAHHLPHLPKHEIVAGVEVVRLSAPIRISRGAVMPCYPWHAWRLASGADAIWISTPLLETAIWAGIAKLKKKRFVITHHGDLHLPSGLLNRFIEHFTHANYRIAARAADTIVGYSADYARFSPYLRPYAEKLAVIHPPILIPRPDPAATASLRQKLNSTDGPIIGFAGRFVQEKRPDVLLRAALQLKSTYPDLKIVFAGQHNLAYENTWRECAPLIQQLGDSVVFLGLLEDAQQLANYYAACDVLALPSESECFALVQVEAMLCGTPVVASDIDGARVPITVTGMGRLFECGNVEALTRTLAEVLAEPHRYQVKREDVARIFSFENTVRAYETVFGGKHG